MRRNPVASTSGTPYDSPHGSDWSTASNAIAAPRSSSSQLTRTVTTKPSLSLLKQEILSEEEYTDALSDIIKRDFFPQLRELDAHNELVRAYRSEDPSQIEESVRRMREVVTPTPRRRNRGATPGRTPFGTEPSDTPTYFSETPSRATPRTKAARAQPETRYDDTLSLDAFQAKYTSEDNSSFAGLLNSDNKVRREKYNWAWDAERKANVKAIRGREARERLVDMTRKMVESDKDGMVRMVEGAPGRPGERRLVVEGGMEAPSRLMVEGKTGGDGRLMITEGGEAVKGMGKGKEVAEGSGFVDWDKPTVEEEEDAKALKDVDCQVPMDGWKFTNRNSFMFPPDADVPFDRDPILPDATSDALPLGDPKAIRYHATRLQEVEKGDPGAPSPSRSRINAAITGTPYPNPTSGTPKVRGFSFVSALPTPRASTIDPQSLQDLMTWGTIDSTPVALSRSSLSSGGGPFHITDTSRREVLAHRMANKAKRSLSARDGEEKKGRANALRTGTPRAAELSPAARMLLGRTGPGRALEGGMGGRERAVKRAREVESRERLRRERWTPSPSVDLGFDPDLPDEPM